MGKVQEIIDALPEELQSLRPLLTNKCKGQDGFICVAELPKPVRDRRGDAQCPCGGSGLVAKDDGDNVISSLMLEALPELGYTFNVQPIFMSKPERRIDAWECQIRRIPKPPERVYELMGFNQAPHFKEAVLGALQSFAENPLIGVRKPHGVSHK